MNIFKIKYPLITAAGLFLLFAAQPAGAQFLNIQIDIEPEVNAEVRQSLDFGQIMANAGRVYYDLGDPNMGVFSIRAIRAQRLLLSIDTPETLQHSELDAQIPIGLNLAYTNFGVDDYRQAEPVVRSPAEIVISPPPGQPDSEWSMAFLYVYGWIDVGNVPTGIYTGDVVLNIEYD